MTTIVTVTCRDPIVSRDGRPFGAGQGNRMRSAGWLLPSVVAGSLRTTLGKAGEREYSKYTADDLLQVECTGLFPVANGEVYFPAPSDCLVHPESGPLRTFPYQVTGMGCDLPYGLQPVGYSGTDVTEDFKPIEGPAWWSQSNYVQWLTEQRIVFDEGFLCSPEVDERTHVQLSPDLGTADEGHLFITAALSLTQLRRYQANGRGPEIVLTTRVRARGWCSDVVHKLDTLHPLGGERRLAHWKGAANGSADWTCPKVISDALSGCTRVRMVLASPAIFADGWKPGWLNNELIGSPPGTSTRLKLVGATLDRWRAVSGWSLAYRGPKPVRRVVPAGGVYFFEITEGQAASLSGRWLESVCDEEQDRRDGFGLATWGTW